MNVLDFKPTFMFPFLFILSVKSFYWMSLLAKYLTGYHTEMNPTASTVMNTRTISSG